MSLSAEEARSFSDLVYSSNGGTPPANWIRIKTSDDYSLSNNGYFGAAYVLLDGNEVQDVIVAHRGTETSDIDDLIADIGIASTLPVLTTQREHADAFLTDVVSYLTTNTPGYTFAGSLNSLVTNVGHSLGGYLAIVAAQEVMGSDGKAITFDNPKTGYTNASIDATVTSYLNPPNLINTAGPGEHVGTIYRLDHDLITGSSETHTIKELAGAILGGAALGLLQIPAGLIDFAGAFIGINSNPGGAGTRTIFT